MNTAPAVDYRPPFPAPYVKVTAFIVANPDSTTSIMIRRKGRRKDCSFGMMVHDTLLDENAKNHEADHILATQFVAALRALREEMKKEPR